MRTDELLEWKAQGGQICSFCNGKGTRYVSWGDEDDDGKLLITVVFCLDCVEQAAAHMEKKFGTDAGIRHFARKNHA